MDVFALKGLLLVFFSLVMIATLIAAVFTMIDRFHKSDGFWIKLNLCLIMAFEIFLAWVISVACFTDITAPIFMRLFIAILALIFMVTLRKNLRKNLLQLYKFIYDNAQVKTRGPIADNPL